jgi:hypothetical protein
MSIVVACAVVHATPLCQMEMTVFNKLVPLVGLMLLAGPVLAVATPSPTTPTSSTTHSTKKSSHKHSHHKKTSKPTQS